jgi:phosphatidylserine/phosphatidylglycerophosphate/cardiolipin synthase-like enzyme
MSRFDRLAILGERHLGSLIGPVIHSLVHRGHRRALDEAIREQQNVRSPRSWWTEEGRWFPGGTPPRRHNSVTVLIDGDAYFQRLCTALTEARRYVYVAGWCLTPHIPLLRCTPDDLIRSRLVDVLSEVSKRVPVRILLWGGAPAIIKPTTKQVKAAQEMFRNQATGDLLCELDNTSRLSHCHHQKAVVVDGELAFVGGIDLTTFGGDRWDRPEHHLRASVNWHDVSTLVKGEVVADVEENFRQRWQAVTGDAGLPHRVADVDESLGTPAQVVRSIPAGRYAFAEKGEFGIHHFYVQAIKRADRLIYLETQYLWSPEVMDALIEAMERKRTQPFRIVIVLPARATSGKWDNDRHVEKLRKADAGRGIAEVYSLYTSGPSGGVHPFQYRPTNVHAKVGIIDDQWLTVGSANLNDRGLVTDSEMNVVVNDPSLAAATRADLWAEHLGLSKDEVEASDPIALVDAVWRQRAADNAAIMKSAQKPLTSQVHRYECGRQPEGWLLEESETLTFEH